jgi:hypothetical protein
MDHVYLSFTARYDSIMRKLLVIFCLVFTCSLAFAAKKPTVTKAFADSNGIVHIVTSDGRDHKIKPKKWQSGGGSEQIKVAQDRRTVGWLVNQMFAPFEAGTNYAYAISLELDIWRDGRVIFRSGPGLGIQRWMFLKDGNEVAFHRAPPNGQEIYECALLDVNTGKELAHWSLDRKNYIVPDWAKPLLVDDPLPGPDEIHWWIPDSPALTNFAPKPKP